MWSIEREDSIVINVTIVSIVALRPRIYIFLAQYFLPNVSTVKNPVLLQGQAIRLSSTTEEVVLHQPPTTTNLTRFNGMKQARLSSSFDNDDQKTKGVKIIID